MSDRSARRVKQGVALFPAKPTTTMINEGACFRPSGEARKRRLHRFTAKVGPTENQAFLRE